jgi:hypothetical protein
MRESYVQFWQLSAVARQLRAQTRAQRRSSLLLRAALQAPRGSWFRAPAQEQPLQVWAEQPLQVWADPPLQRWQFPAQVRAAHKQVRLAPQDKPELSAIWLPRVQARPHRKPTDCRG